VTSQPLTRKGEKKRPSGRPGRNPSTFLFDKKGKKKGDTPRKRLEKKKKRTFLLPGQKGGGAKCTARRRKRTRWQEEKKRGGPTAALKRRQEGKESLSLSEGEGKGGVSLKRELRKKLATCGKKRYTGNEKEAPRLQEKKGRKKKADALKKQKTKKGRGGGIDVLQEDPGREQRKHPHPLDQKEKKVSPREGGGVVKLPLRESIHPPLKKEGKGGSRPEERKKESSQKKRKNAPQGAKAARGKEAS